jgi:hypothetical protein
LAGTALRVLFSEVTVFSVAAAVKAAPHVNAVPIVKIRNNVLVK